MIPAANATRGDNTRDNVEMVEIFGATQLEPPHGTYTVKVTHKGDLLDGAGQVGAQNLSLVVSGAEALPAPDFRITLFETDGSGGYDLGWPTVVGGLYEVERSGDLVNWTFDQEVSPTSVFTVANVVPPASSTEHFYRIKRTK